MPATRATEPRARTLLWINSADCGFVVSADGGDPVAEIVREPSGAFVRKHLGAVTYDSASIRLTLPLATPVWDWIKRAWTAKPLAVDATFVHVDATLHEREKRELHRASITEIAFPVLDGASKEQAALTVTVSAERSIDAKASGKVAPPAKSTAQRRWLGSGFRLELGGLDTKGVSRIEGFTVRSALGTAIDFPSLRVALPAVQVKPWQDWFDHFVLEGHNAGSDEKTGALALLAPDRKELARITLQGVGIAKLARMPSAAEAGVGRYVAELYCQRMEFGPTPP